MTFQKVTPSKCNHGTFADVPDVLMTSLRAKKVKKQKKKKKSVERRATEVAA